MRLISSVTVSTYLAHRVMEDVRAMKRIFSSNLLHSVLSNLTIRSKTDIVGYWQTLHHERVTSHCSQQFIIHFGSLCTKRMAKRLNEYNFTFEMLKSTFQQNCDDRQDFNNELQIAGIKRPGVTRYGVILLDESRHKFVGISLVKWLL